MNLSISQLQLVIDGLFTQLYDLLTELQEGHILENDFVSKAREVIELLAKFITLKKEKLARES